MTNETRPEPAVDRRFLLRGGAVLAGAAGATVIGAALAPTAQAADGQPVLIGDANTAESTTTVTIAGGGDAALSLVNPTGPSLQLSSVGVEYVGDLDVGEIVNTDLGPDIGVDYGDGATTDYLATGNDLFGLPTPFAIDPQRLLDTRRASGRERIVDASSGTPLTSEGKLKAGQWIDVAVGTVDSDFPLSAVFVNAAVIGPVANGYLIVYPPADSVPSTSTINYRAGVSLANAAFVALGVYEDDYVVRIWTSQTTHLLFDLSGGVSGAPTELAIEKKSGNRRAQRQAKQIARIRKSLARS